MTLENQQPLLQPHQQRNRRGTWAYVCFTNCTVLVGAGVLTLPWSFSFLGWFWGPLTLTLAFITSFSAAYILSLLHEQDGRRFDQYTTLGIFIFGPSLGPLLITPFQLATNIGTGIVYFITGAQSAQQAYRLAFPDKEQHLPFLAFVCAYAIIQLFLVQLRDFHSLRWISFGGAVMALGYCMIATVASVIHAQNHWGEADYSQRDTILADQFSGVCNALGSIFFSFGGMATFLEIQAALPSPSQKPMLKGFSVSYVLSLMLYFVVAISGYLAFGNNVNENILLSVGRPAWVIIVANVMVFLHVVAAYQVYSMAVFEWFQDTVGKDLSHKWAFRLVYRGFYVLAGALIASALPFFAAMNGLVGAIGIGMTTFVVPFLMVIVFYKARLNLFAKWLMIAIIVVMVIWAILGGIGALYGIYVEFLD